MALTVSSFQSAFTEDALLRGEIIFFSLESLEVGVVVRSRTIAMVLNSTDGREMVIDGLHAGEKFDELEDLS